MSTEEHRADTEPDFFPKNIEFLGFIGGWDCYLGVDTVQMWFYLIRTKDRDWLEAVAKYSDQIISRNCVISIPRHGSRQEAAARLLDAHVRSEIHYECPVPPYRSGFLLTNTELESIVGAIAKDLSAIVPQGVCRNTLTLRDISAKIDFAGMHSKRANQTLATTVN